MSKVAVGISVPPMRSFHLLYHLSEFCWHIRDGLPRKEHFSIRPLADTDIKMTHFRAFLGAVLAEMCTAALRARQRSTGDRLGNSQQIRQVEGGMPAAVVLAVAIDPHTRGALA